MEACSREVSDGPTPYQSISLKQSEVDDATGNTLFIFLVVTAKFPSGIPVAVVETPQGWRVDWQAFVEFRDDRFKKFAEEPADQIGRFQLIVSAPPPARAANTENQHFVSFLLDPPYPGRQQLAFVKRDSEACTIFQSATANGQIFTPVLEVAMRTTPDGKSYLEIIKELAHGPEGAADPEATFALTEKARAPLAKAVQASLQPVEHSLTITPAAAGH